MSDGQEITEEDIKSVLTSMVRSYDHELDAYTQEDLENDWFFKYDATRSEAQNLYEFMKMIDLYGKQCRRWEERKNGYCCVVERVRDKYLWPKIQEFLKDLRGGV